ncbi:MAG: malonate decarboxylase subunit alpha [Bryobacterales bacterium]|nr:malonate decarboxylase subunit alpha [Bryobacterales bacterium]
MRVRIVTAAEAVREIKDGANIATGGFVGAGHPEALTVALRERFLEEGKPRGLTLIYAAGQGDAKDRGLNHVGLPGLVRRVIGGHWNLAPALARLAVNNEIEAYNFPQGVISKLFREIASGNPGMLSRIGLGTFVDPRLGGGKVNLVTHEDLVEVMQIGGREMLWYRAVPVDVALIRGTASDEFGNISFEREVMTGEALAIAQAAKNSGGMVIAQVEELVPNYSRDPKSIRVPGIFVDCVVAAPRAQHPQTYDCEYDDAFVTQGNCRQMSMPCLEAGPRRYIAARCFAELRPREIVNLGIGIPEGVAQLAAERKAMEDFVLTVEAGVIGGVPAGGMSFGASRYPQAIIDQPYMFDFYDGGGLDVAVLSMAECDEAGNVNVSKYGNRLPGIGGFMNIAHSARRVVFAGTFTAGQLCVDWDGERLRIVEEGASRKFVRQVQQISFAARVAMRHGAEAMYVTERAVFRLREDGLELAEVAPGIDVEKDVLAKMDFRPAVSSPLKEMDAEIFRPASAS